MAKRNKSQNSHAASSTPGAEKSAQDVERNKIYDEYRRELTVKQNSNSENYDKNILTLSSAGLGLSLAFIKDIVPRQEMTDQGTLLLSWLFFGLAIIATLVSFQFSQLAIQAALNDAVEYYINRKDEFRSRECAWARWTGRLNWASGVLFVLATLTTAIFVARNFPSSKKHGNIPVPIQSADTAPSGHAPAPKTEHRTTGESASATNPTSKEIKP